MFQQKSMSLTLLKSTVQEPPQFRLWQFIIDDRVLCPREIYFLHGKLTLEKMKTTQIDVSAEKYELNSFNIGRSL
jgi:hypothetical protein